MKIKEAKEWLDFALKDIKAAELLGSEGEYDLANYHLQQAAEKSIKAILVLYDLKGKGFKSHNITKLLSLLVNANFNIPDFILNAENLSRYAFTTRYPDDYVPVSKEEYEEAYGIALKVYKWVKGIIEGSALE